MFEHVCSTRWHCCTYGKVCMCVHMLGVSVGEVYMDVCEGGVVGQRYMFGSGDVKGQTLATPT